MRWLSKGVFHHCRKLKTSGPNGEESSFIGVPVIETVDFICQYSSENDIRVGLPATKLKELILRCTWGTLQTRLSNHEVNTWTYSCGQILRQTRGGTAAEYHPVSISTPHMLTIHSLFATRRRNSSSSWKMKKFLKFLCVGLSRRETSHIERNVFFHKCTRLGKYTHFSSCPLPVQKEFNKVLSRQSKKDLRSRGIQYENGV